MLLRHEKFLGLTSPLLSTANQAVLPIRIWLFKEGLSHHMLLLFWSTEHYWKNKPFSPRAAPSLPSALTPDLLEFEPEGV